EAGRDLDALVAAKVMGFDADRIISGGGYRVGNHTPSVISWAHIPQYSTDIAAAWEVVEKLIHLDPLVAIWGYEDGSIGWYCDFEGSKAHARTAPHAVCLAALKAIG
ncbi:MAG: hypothetical protein M3R24_30430, partial [Chloroflexota bacterium]|nr:hypothetical protein [Chloroflexota bacterium]